MAGKVAVEKNSQLASGLNAVADSVTDSMTAIIKKIPAGAFKKDSDKAFGYLYRDYLILILSVMATIWADSYWIGIPLSLLTGTMFIALFIVGHDAGHRSFSNSEKVNNFVGHITTSLCLWPFHIWRLSHDIHHKHTHNIKKEIAWRPMTIKQYMRRSPLQRLIYRATRKGFMFVSSMIFTWYFFKDGLRGRRSLYFKPEEMGQVRFSIFVTVLINAAMIWGAVSVAGLYGLICLYVIPQIVFQVYLSIFTYFHHTIPERNFLAEEQWTMEKAQLANTLHVEYPRFVEWACHDIMVHVPHHVCVGIPHYHLRTAHKALKEAYPEVVKEHRLTVDLIRRSIATCHLVKGKDLPEEMEWVTFAEAHATAKQPEWAR